jgi:hypothetical protein
MRSVRGLDLRAIRRQHPDRNLQSPSRWVHDRDRTISPLRSAEDLKGNAMEWMKGVEDLDVRIFRAQGILGVGVTTRTCIASCPPEAYLSMDNDGSVRGRSSFYR